MFSPNETNLEGALSEKMIGFFIHTLLHKCHEMFLGNVFFPNKILSQRIK